MEFRSPPVSFTIHFNEGDAIKKLFHEKMNDKRRKELMETLWQCKPQVQVTGTIYVPFCGEPRQARLAVLQLLLQHTDTIQQT
jgi:hypothetical protein